MVWRQLIDGAAEHFKKWIPNIASKEPEPGTETKNPKPESEPIEKMVPN